MMALTTNNRKEILTNQIQFYVRHIRYSEGLYTKLYIKKTLKFYQYLGFGRIYNIDI